MKIDVNRIPLEGLTLSEEVNASRLDLDTDIARFREPIKITADISKITNVVTVEIELRVEMSLTCSRCLEEFQAGLNKNFRLNYEADKAAPIIDLGQDIKEEIIVDYPLKPLCRPDCKGLCPKCGSNLNEGKCKCVSL